MKELFRVVYGSRLYGTNTPTSDFDEKVIYLPDLNSLLLGHKPSIYKQRFNEKGEQLLSDAPMPPGGTETEFIPLQQFVRDFVRGQTYALEVAFAISTQVPFVLINELIKNFCNAEVYSMVGFAKKQCLDYVKRGERLKAARQVLSVIQELRGKLKDFDYLERKARLDDMHEGDYVLDAVAERTGLKVGKSQNGARTLRTLELNGRSYLETTELRHLEKQLQELINAFGERTNAAAEDGVDYKSLSHAIRVYQQAIELLDTGKITFPRPNAKFLLQVKEGKADMEQVKQLLVELDNEVQKKIETSALQRRTPELETSAEKWLLQQLQHFYFNEV